MRWLGRYRQRLYRWRWFRATLYHLPLSGDRCSMCGNLITDATSDRNLLADWTHCDRCMSELLKGMDG